MPGKGDPFDVFPCYCPCHAKPRVRPGEGIWVCDDCSFTADDFEDLAHHVYEVHPGTAV
jgi:ribosomal protein L37AE/L43A